MQVSLGEVDLFYINDPHDKLTSRGVLSPVVFCLNNISKALQKSRVNGFIQLSW